MTERIPEENIAESTGNAVLDKRVSMPFLRGDKGVDTAQVWMSAFLIVVVGVIAYSNIFAIPFHAEDRDLLFAGHALPGVSGLSLLTLKINQLISPHSPVLFHVKNLSIHIANALLLFLLCRRLIPGATPVIAMLAGMLFVAHPLATESVDYIVGRPNLLAAFFMLCSLLAFASVVKRESDEDKAHVRLWPLMISVFCFALAWGAARSAVVLPVIVLALDLCLNRDVPGRVRALLYAPYWLVLALIATVTYAASGAAPVTPTGPRSAFEFARLMVVPYPLSVFHQGASHGALFGLLAACVIMALLPVLCKVGRFFQNRPLNAGEVGTIKGAGFGKTGPLSVGAFALVWAAETILITGNGAAGIRERDAYFAIAGLALIVPWAFQLVRGPSLRAVVGMAAAVLVIAAATGVYLRNDVWQSEITLWSDALANAPDSVVPLQHLGHAFLIEGENAGQSEDAAAAFVRAEQACRSALEKDQENFPAAHDLAVAVMRQERGDEAIGLFRNVIRADIADRDALIGMAELLMNRAGAANSHEDLVRAVDYYRRADALKPLEGLPLTHYAAAMLQMGDLENTVRIVARVNAENPEAKNDGPREMLNKIDRMEKEAAQLLAKDPADVAGLKFQAQALALRNQFVIASYVLDALGRAKVRDFAVWLLMGFVRARMNGCGHFIQEWGTTPEKPGAVKSAWAELARVCAGAGMWDAALAYLESPSARAENKAGPLVILSEIGLKLQQPQRAGAYLKKAVAAYPNDPTPWLYLCGIAAAEKDMASAQQDLTEAEKRGADPSVLADYYKKLGIAPPSNESTTQIIR